MDILIFQGYVGRDAEMRYTPSGKAVTKFSVAVNRSYKKENGEWINRTIWYNVVCWGGLAEAMNSKVHKGMLATVQGRLEPDFETGSPRMWENKEGRSMTSYEVTASSVKVTWEDKEKNKENVHSQDTDFDQEEDRF